MKTNRTKLSILNFLWLSLLISSFSSKSGQPTSFQNYNKPEDEISIHLSGVPDPLPENKESITSSTSSTNNNSRKNPISHFKINIHKPVKELRFSENSIKKKGFVNPEDRVDTDSLEYDDTEAEEDYEDNIDNTNIDSNYSSDNKNNSTTTSKYLFFKKMMRKN